MPPYAHAAAAAPLGVDLAGYFTAGSGLAVVARNVAAALEGAGVAVTPIALPYRGAPAPGPQRSGGHPATVICVSPDGMRGARAALGAALEGRRVIGLWWWEVAGFPGRFARAFDGVDEIWVGSRFMADVLAPVSPVPVVRVPTPVPEPRPDPLSRTDLGLPDGFLFGGLYDYGSVLARKNPLGAIEAFRRAFEPQERDVALVLKALGGDRYPDQHAQVLGAAAADDRIHVIDADLSAGRKDALLASLDCLVSLHRSEGFGLPIAEAMLLGKPVVATDHGGARDLLSAFNGYPVDFRLTAVGPGHDPYPADAEWAEPDLDHAAARLREVREHPGQASARGARAREDVRREHAPAAAGRAMAARMERALGLDAVRPEAALDLSDLERRLRAGDAAGDSPRGPVRRVARRALLRALRPHTVQQRLTDEELLRALRTLDERVRGAVAGQQALAAQLRERDTGTAGGPEAPVSPSSPLER